MDDIFYLIDVDDLPSEAPTEAVPIAVAPPPVFESLGRGKKRKQAASPRSKRPSPTTEETSSDQSPSLFGEPQVVNKVVRNLMDFPGDRSQHTTLSAEELAVKATAASANTMGYLISLQEIASSCDQLVVENSRLLGELAGAKGDKERVEVSLRREQDRSKSLMDDLDEVKTARRSTEWRLGEAEKKLAESEKKLADSEALAKKLRDRLTEGVKAGFDMGLKQMKALHGDLDSSRCGLNMTVVDGKLVPKPRRSTSSTSIAATNTSAPSEAASAASLPPPPPPATTEAPQPTL